LTSWVTFTGYTAKRNKSSDRSHQAGAPDRLNGVGAVDENRSLSRARLNKTYGNIPLSFEANSSQTDPSVNYFARGPGYNIFFTSAEAVLVFPEAGINSEAPAVDEKESDETSVVDPVSRQRPRERFRQRAAEQDATGAKPTILRMRLDGADTKAQSLQGVDELPGKVNYFFGNDPSKWNTNVSTYTESP
jgi:hypothetical protein